MKSCNTIHEYLQDTPQEFRSKLKEMRALVTKLVPKGKETIKYGMPTIELNGKNFLHYAAMKGHLGFYPTPSGVKAFQAELVKKNIDFSKGCIRFPYSEPLPVALVKRIISFRLKEL